ncbi:MAG: hypothetical protein RJA22_2239 [Verrucomicrobiota bacterium]
MLAGNLVLFALILGHLLRTPRSWPGAGAGTSPGGAGPDAAEQGPRPAETQVVLVTNEVRWAQLESEDYPTYIARLRAAGCPEQTIRDIIIADLDKVLAPEIQAAQGRRKQLAYWHSEEEELANDVDRREVERREREIDRRKRQIIRELLNIDLARERMELSGRQDYLERRLSFLPGERRSEVRDVLERLDEAEQQLRERELEEGDSLTQAERAQLRDLRAQREAELGRLLSPAERQQFDLWLSPTANAVRQALYGMQASEQEFLAVYGARKAFEDRWQAREAESLDAALLGQREQERVRMETRIQEQLGEQRYAEYKRGEDEDFHRLSAVVTRFQLPRDKAAEAYGYKQVAQSYRARVLGDAQLDARQRAEALQSINQETEKAVRELLGDRAYRYLVRSGQAGWVRE